MEIARGFRATTLDEVVEMDPSLKDYCDWRRRALEKKAKQHRQSPSQRHAADGPPSVALSGGAQYSTLQAAATKLRECGIDECPELRRLEAMKARLAALQDF